ncbi:MAG: GntR family transcriptional regulator [Peptococcaceae bacterium]
MKVNGDKPLERKVLRYEIKKILTEAILNGDIGPGERIIETRIAKDLQVSQAPVREAIRELEHMGLVETQPYKGAFVKIIKKEEVFEAYKLRILIESYAAEIVGGKINPDLLAEFATLISRMKQYGADNNRTEFIELDISFHELIIKSTESTLLYRIWSIINMAHLPYLTFTKSTMSFSSLVLQHERIYEAFKECNPEKAAKAVKDHIEELGEKITDHF